MAQEAGHPGIVFRSMWGFSGKASSEFVPTLRQEGYQSHSAYEWKTDHPSWCYGHQRDHTNMDHGQLHRNGSRYYYRDDLQLNGPIFEAGRMQTEPASFAGWDDYPWNIVKQQRFYNRTPENFLLLLQDMKTYLDSTSGITNRTVARLGARNEWGEGHYPEPGVEYGMGMYKAMHKAFATGPMPTVAGPIDLQGWNYGDYDVLGVKRLDPNQDRREFSTSGDPEGWEEYVFSMTEPKIDGGSYCSRILVDNPLIPLKTGLQVRASDYSGCQNRMKARGSAGSTTREALYWFWSGEDYGIDWTNQGVNATVPLDDQYHTYDLALAGKTYWRC